ncbi:alpha/beta fold hydrolase [Mycolicibacterium smegmatis]|uniref:Salicylate esterase n=3 Tax=Mycolicibacterium smegmatis TaxID=1772 RepID=A0QTD1_MYCS2|nr:alpha/beta hydrolase [Mycolicibacterium smegmatis]ABK72895.1 salicylate esterase [Mycolicibacterium smegmatis MC2 155]AFP38224.1 Salicylate esterase [Mycolicibacterium smegmatis MC2 155]AIU07019.1 salicylate esterase [Mycolicibacterium smegmatis MC2 155]AIU13644.1 salicylate esterase [Mycolicibacterium smegmatis]AIU20268.1 salicylate esterase [Mycolicibacterium smegmatis]
MADFVIVHGSWHDGTLLEPVAAAIRGLGHRAYAPTVAGHGHGADTDVSIDDGVQSVIDYCRTRDLREIVLVGHSLGGTIIARVAEEIPDRITRLIFWSAFVPRPGRSITEEVEQPSTPAAEKQAPATGSSETLSLQVWRDVFVPDVDPEQAATWHALLSPEPRRPKTERLDLRRFYRSTLPMHYIDAVDDRALPRGLDREAMIERLKNVRVHRVRGGHEVLFTDPAGIAAVIVEAGVS